MTTPFELLGLDDDADERAIKRAYAARLRQTRPDNDPAGFQRLNEAYRAALAWLRGDYAEEERLYAPISADVSAHLHRQTESPDLEATEPATENPAAQVPWQTQSLDPAGIDATPKTPAAHIPWQTESFDRDTAEPTPRTAAAHVPWQDEFFESEPSNAIRLPADAAQAIVDFPAFFVELSDCAANGDAAALREWLARRPDLFALQTKAAVGRLTLAALFEHSPAMPVHCAEAVLAFFDLDQVHAEVDPLQWRALCAYMEQRWYFEERERYRSRPPLDVAARFEQAGFAALLADFARPFRWTSALSHALLPMRPRRIAAFLRSLDPAQAQQLSERGCQRHLLFWRRAGDQERISLARTAIGAARCAVLIAVCAVLFGPLAWKSGDSLRNFLLQISLAVLAPWAIYLLWSGIGKWQGRAQNEQSGPAAWWRLGFIPLMTAGALVAQLLTTAAATGGRMAMVWRTVSVLLFIVANVFALERYVRRILMETRSDRYFWFVLAFGLVSVTAALLHKLPPLAFFVLVPMTLWSVDLWVHRGSLPRRQRSR